MQREHTKITLETENGVFSVEVPQIELPLPELIDQVVSPVLLAAGYSQAVINACLTE